MFVKVRMKRSLQWLSASAMVALFACGTSSDGNGGASGGTTSGGASGSSAQPLTVETFIERVCSTIAPCCKEDRSVKPDRISCGEQFTNEAKGRGLDLSVAEACLAKLTEAGKSCGTLVLPGECTAAFRRSPLSTPGGECAGPSDCASNERGIGTCAIQGGDIIGPRRGAC
jgi:hypothetical protein